jgi:hypothetical protein
MEARAYPTLELLVGTPARDQEGATTAAKSNATARILVGSEIKPR